MALSSLDILLIVSGLIFVSMILIVVWIMHYIGYISFRDERAKKILTLRQRDAWQELADNYGLTCVPGGTFNKAHVFGIYRNCQLNLGVDKKQRREGSIEVTTMTLSLNEATVGKQQPLDLEQIKLLLTLSNIPFTIKGEIDINSSGQIISYTQFEIEYNRIYLQVLIDYLYKLLQAYQILIKPQCELIIYLQTIARFQGLVLQPFAEQTMRRVSESAQKREHLRLICPTCLAYYREETNSLLDLNFGNTVGCRICDEQQGYFVGKIIAVLDNQMNTEIVQENHELRVNWLICRRIFDFDEIEIEQATDQEVERFLVQVGNDSDSFQKSRYKDVQYKISVQCELSDNTNRILKRMFGGLKENHIHKVVGEEFIANTIVNSA